MPFNYYNNIRNGTVPANAPAYYPTGAVIVNGSGSNSTSSSSSLQKIIDSGTPITGGSSAASVANTAASMAGLAQAAPGFDFDGLFQLLKENTNYNNAWSAAQAQKQMDFQTQANQIAMDFNAAEAAKNRDWQEMMSNTAHQREIADLKAAGLNPVLSASGGNGAAVTSGSAASGVTSSGAQADADQSANTALAAIYGSIMNAQTSMYNANLSARTNLQMAQMQTEAQMYGAQLAAEANKYAAGTAYAASTYGADKSLQNSQEQRAWNAEHPSSGWQAASDLGNAIFGNPGSNTGSGKGFFASAGEMVRDGINWLRDAHEARKQK